MPKDKHNSNDPQAEHRYASAPEEEDADSVIQVVCLGSGGGPNEDNVTGFLVRSLVSGWSKGSLLAVDAGSHLAAITRILEKSFPLYSKDSAAGPTKTSTRSTKSAEFDSQRTNTTELKEGPFAGVNFPNESARANALHLLHSYISCYMITHPHLDHLSGFTINTAAFHGKSRPKTLAALPNTVDAVKRHIFNDIIWPNLSDEDGGVGFVSYQRLKEGGDYMIGEGDGRGYINVCDGLAARAFSVSHELCTKGPPMHHRGSISNAADFAAALNGHGNADPATMTRSMSGADYASLPGTPGAHRQSMYNIHGQAQHGQSHVPCVVDSTAFFIRDEEKAREVLIFGDVEPDSVSMAPRNEQVWTEAAPRVADGRLRGILIECSYSDAVSDETLFGHLCPRHLIVELTTLAEMVHTLKSDSGQKKRKRSAPDSTDSRRHSEQERKRSRSQTAHLQSSRDTSGSAEFDNHQQESVHFSREGDALSPRAQAARHVSAVPPALSVHVNRSRRWGSQSWDTPPLAGLTVVIIHIKDTYKDGPPVSDTILSQLNEHEKILKGNGRALGCKFVVSKCGGSYWF
ncbi:hypothetical protein AMS68_001687 [Peltaster fructicola]|uniref:3',5'-cyclic-nucleotide phosphodiesterase n=1 Tax=Peltaster fructicola TaxID=286661 RepID=A0A6H0XNV5_9PEZI|nr:hypothetical protein AMS68_001687 [Peltaster fructicola]